MVSKSVVAILYGTNELIIHTRFTNYAAAKILVKAGLSPALTPGLQTVIQ